MKKGKQLIVVVGIASCMLTGCIDNMPELTAEQSGLIAEYSADLLLKYSPNYQYRLADEEDLIVEEPTQEETTEEETSQAEETTQEAASEQSESVPETSESAQQPEEDLLMAGEVDIAELLDTENISVRCDGYEVTDSYPKVGTSGTGFTVDAPQGRTLVIVHFEVVNTGTDTVTCDFFDQNLNVRVNANGQGYREALNTLLVNDIITYIDELEPGETTDVVAVAAMNQTTAEDLDSLTVQVIRGRNTLSIQVK